MSYTYKPGDRLILIPAASFEKLDSLRRIVADGWGEDANFGLATQYHAERQALEEPGLSVFQDAFHGTDGEVELADPGIVSDGDEGAYVMTWSWVSNDDAGIENPVCDEEAEEGEEDDH